MELLFWKLTLLGTYNAERMPAEQALPEEQLRNFSITMAELSEEQQELLGTRLI